MSDTEEYFVQLASCRKAAVEGEVEGLLPDEVELIRRYVELMGANKTSPECASPVVTTTPVSIHEIWARNALARYFCYVENDFQRAETNLVEAILRLEAGFPGGFKPSEANVLLPILLLNFIRIARLAGDIPKAQKRLIQLKNLLMWHSGELTEGASVLEDFPKEIFDRTDWINSWIVKNLTSSTREYMNAKVTALETKLGAP